MSKSGLTFSFKDEFEKFGKKIEDLGMQLQGEANQAMADAAEAAYASIVADAQAKLKSTRQDYLSGLQFGEIAPGHYAITLDGKWPNALEDGFASFDMTKGMLASSATVSTGARAGQPWVQTSKAGNKFAHVPVQKGTGAATMGDALQQIKAKNMKDRKQKITSVFKDANNNPLQGKVAVGTGEKDNPLKGVVKYQRVTEDKSGKKRTESLYIMYRTVSEVGRPWIHPGYGGLKAFDSAEEELIKNLNQIVKDFAG